VLLSIINSTDIPVPNQKPNENKGDADNYIYKPLPDALGPACSDGFIQNQEPNKVKNRTDNNFWQIHYIPPYLFRLSGFGLPFRARLFVFFPGLRFTTGDRPEHRGFFR